MFLGVFQEVFVGIDGVDTALVQHDDFICIADGRYTLGDNDGGGILQILTEALTYGRVGSGVYRAGAVIQNDDFGLFQECSGNAETLLLAAGYIDAALSQVGVVALWEGHDKVMGTGSFGSGDDFFVCGILIAPFQIVPDRA